MAALARSAGTSSIGVHGSGLRGRSLADAAGPEAAADRSGAISRPARAVRSWPLLVLAAPAAAEVWSGWVGIAQKTGFGRVSPLPGIWPSLHLDTTITLPVGVEAYAAYALRAWLTSQHTISARTRRFAKWSAIGSFALGMAGQVAYHLLAQAGVARAPWAITTIVACLPVLVLAMGTTLAHMLRADAARDTPDSQTSGPATSRSPDRSDADQTRPGPDQTGDRPASARSGPGGTKTSPHRDQNAAVGTTAPAAQTARAAQPEMDQAGPSQDLTAGGGTMARACPQPGTGVSALGDHGAPLRAAVAPVSQTVHPKTDEARRIARRLAAAGKPVTRRALRSGGVKGSNETLNALARRINTELVHTAAPRGQT